MNAESGRWLWRLVGAGILFPLFFQIKSGIYDSPAALIDSLGEVAIVPIPFSVMVCLAALTILRDQWKKQVSGWQ